MPQERKRAVLRAHMRLVRQGVETPSIRRRWEVTRTPNGELWAYVVGERPPVDPRDRSRNRRSEFYAKVDAIKIYAKKARG